MVFTTSLIINVTRDKSGQELRKEQAVTIIKMVITTLGSGGRTRNRARDSFTVLRLGSCIEVSLGLTPGVNLILTPKG